MTGQLPLPLGDCDPAWAAAEPRRPHRPVIRDLRHQHASRRRLNRIVDVPVVGNYL
ncbi:hypothetical protein [Streptomyces sp. NPDC014793]|uniref:hypothetical protein n=1 Tax=Streptomyces sp. NPDC014793 TaxID=3364914 RepID=UPI0037012170